MVDVVYRDTFGVNSLRCDYITFNLDETVLICQWEDEGEPILIPVENIELIR